MTWSVGRGGNSSADLSQGVASPITAEDIEGSAVLSLGNISNTGKYGTTNVNLSLSDYGAIDSAFEFAGQSLDNAFTFAAGAFQEGAGMMDRALQTSDAARIDALEFGAGAMQAAFAEAERARMASAEAQAMAARQVAAAQRDANELVAANTAKSISAVRASTVDAMQFSAGAFQEAVNSMDRANEASLDSVIGFSNDAIEYVANSTRSEASQSFDKLVKVAGWSVAAIAGTMLIPRLLAAL